MLDVSLELVPRSPDQLRLDLCRARQAFPSVATVNLPDLPRFDLRSWEACALARATHDRALPHLRACDVDLLDRGTPGRLGLTGLKDLCVAHGFGEVIVVQGDDPSVDGASAPTTSIELIGALRQALPELRIFAALDPYRSSPCRERDYALAKRAAGACGFFTQPFFDLRHQEVWADLLSEQAVYWGLSPILTPGSRRYWERRNRAFLPRCFEPTLAWNRAYAQGAVDWAEREGQSLYFMPIRVDVVEWLGGVLR